MIGKIRVTSDHDPAERIIDPTLEKMSDQEKKIAALEHENSLLRNLVRESEPDREKAEYCERMLEEIGRSIGCNHIDDRLPSCVREAMDLHDDLVKALRCLMACSLPNDVSGKIMVDFAADVLRRALKVKSP